jgi:hypothetical protein
MADWTVFREPLRQSWPLLAVNTALTMGLAWQTVIWQPLATSPAEPMTGQTSDSPVSIEASDPTLPLSDYREIAERPLFDRERQSAAPAVIATPIEPAAVVESRPPPPPPPTRWRLLGTARVGTQEVALLRRNDEPDTVRLSEGDKFEGWEVIEITAQAVTLAHDSGRVQIPLEPPDHTGPSTPHRLGQPPPPSPSAIQPRRIPPPPR